MKSIKRNEGLPLDLDLIKEIRVNRSAVERRAATINKRRTVKKDWQAAWNPQTSGIGRPMLPQPLRMPKRSARPRCQFARDRRKCTNAPGERRETPSHFVGNRSRDAKRYGSKLVRRDPEICEPSPHKFPGPSRPSRPARQTFAREMTAKSDRLPAAYPIASQ